MADVEDYLSSHKTKIQVFVAFALLCLSMISHYLSVRITDFKYKRKHKKAKLHHYLTVLVIFLSWVFIYSCVLLTLGNDDNQLVCTISFMLCAFSYCSVKLSIYVLLLEKAFMIQPFSGSKDRLKSRFYIFNMCLLLPYLCVLVLMLTYHIADIDPETSVCRIGIGNIASSALITYDTLFSIYVTAICAKPLLAIKDDSKLKIVTVKTFMAAAVTLLSSGLNILSFVLVPMQLAIQCYAFCIVDIMFNTISVHWMSTPFKGKRLLWLKIDAADVAADTERDVRYTNRGSVVGNRRASAFGVSHVKSKIAPVAENPSTDAGK